MNKTFSVKETIIYSVQALIEHPWYFVKLFLKWIAFCVAILLPLCILMGLLTLFGTVASASVLIFVILSSLFLLAYLLALVYIWCAPTKLLLYFYDNGPVKIHFADFFKMFSISKLFKLIGVFLLYAIIVTFGLVLFIIPGIYLAIKLQFALFYMIDKNISVREAFKRSYAATTGNFWRILAVDVIAAVLMQLIITIPISYLMGMYMYRKLG
jgi:Membrane domain of glycerophosphoryl diester phosphodiesterase